MMRTNLGLILAAAMAACGNIAQNVRLIVPSANEDRASDTKHQPSRTVQIGGDDIPSHIASGKIVTRLGMTWADKISFVLTDKLQLKRVCFLDILKEASEGQAENEQERFDIDFTLMTGEVANLLHDLLQALGGEVV